MNIHQLYDYLIRARQELWAALERVPDEVLSRPLLEGQRFHCLKDLIFHIAAVEDSWLHEDILRDAPVLQSDPALANAQDGPQYAGIPLETLLRYWKTVQESTLKYLAMLNEAELKRPVTPFDRPDGPSFTAGGLLWHFMLHEVRHTAQICVLLRTQGIKPPALDLLYYLPQVQAKE